MCAIVDANTAAEVFGRDKTEAGSAFFNWLVREHGRLIVGGEVRRELLRTSARELLQQMTLAGRAFTVDDERVDAAAEAVRPQCRSDDPHVVALAQVSGARLLYSNDMLLHQDFGDARLISAPRGSVFSTNRSDRLSRHHRRLLRRNDLCGAAG